MYVMNWGPFGNRELAWHTDLDIEECERRLDEMVDTERFSLGAMYKSRPLLPVRGEVYVPYVRLQMETLPRGGSRPITSGVAFQGKLERDPAGSGTTLTGTFNTNTMAVLSMGLWLWLILGAVAALLVEGSGVAKVLAVLLVTAGSLAMLSYGKNFGKYDEKYLAEFIEDTLEAEQVAQ